MFLYYQTAEDGHQAWQPVVDIEADQVRREKAYHMSIYKLSELPGGVTNTDDIAYKGDLWFDIDHKPADDTDAARQASLKAAIMDARRLLSYLESVGVEADACKLYASGSKGFHVCVPAKLFDARAAIKSLPKVHKYMAGVIAAKAEIHGLDDQLYCCGKGRLLRVENKQRANGKYKVPVTADEIRTMTPELYVELTSEPRTLPEPTVQGFSADLNLLYKEGKDEFASGRKEIVSTVTDTEMAVFSDADHPVCVQWLVNHEQITPGDGTFNKAKMSLARYLMSAPLTDAERYRLVDQFAEAWHRTPSGRYPTLDSRRKAVTETFNFGKEQGFSCDRMRAVLSASPCQNCKLKQAQQQAIAETIPIEETDYGYFRVAAKGQGQNLSNFTLQPRMRYVNVGEDVNMFVAFIYDVYINFGKGPEVVGQLTLPHKAWQSNAEFKRQISNFINLRWTGADNDLQNLKSLLTSPAICNGVETMSYVPSVGIHRHVDERRGINELVWVEEGYSINAAGVMDTLRFNGHPVAQNVSRTVKLAAVKPYDGRDSAQNETLRMLLKANVFKVLAPSLGWMFSCWLRTHIRDGETTEKHLPALQIFGSAGHGKTETSTLLSILAGANYLQTDALVVSSATPYAIRSEVAISTTVPRIFDEFNDLKQSDRRNYQAAYEAVKAAARGSAMPRGVLTDGGVGIDNKIATSPIITLATQQNPKMEINDRSVPVSISSNERTPEHARCFQHVRRNVKHLLGVTKLAMLTTLNLPQSWVASALERAHDDMPPELQMNRTATNWEMVLVGLDYMRYVLELGEAPRDIVDNVIAMRRDLLPFLVDEFARVKKEVITQEIDVILNTFGEMIVNDVGSITRKFSEGDNYIVAGDTLHIFSTVFFTQYLKYCRNEIGRPPELSSIAQYRNLLSHQPYYLGKGMAPGVKTPSGWDSFSLEGMRGANIQTDNFVTD